GVPKAKIEPISLVEREALSTNEEFQHATTIIERKAMEEAKREEAAVENFQQAKTALSESAVFQDAETALGRTAKLVRAEKMMKAALAREKPIKFYNGLPRPGLPWTIEAGGKKITLEVGDVLGQGCFFTAYRVKDPTGAGRDLVLKVLNKGSPELEV